MKEPFNPTKTEYKPLSKEQLLSIKPGDVIERMLGFSVPMYLKVQKVEDGIIDAGWTFSQETGLEVDDMIHYNVSYIKTILTEEQKLIVKEKGRL